MPEPKWITTDLKKAQELLDKLQSRDFVPSIFGIPDKYLIPNRSFKITTSIIQKDEPELYTDFNP